MNPSLATDVTNPVTRLRRWGGRAAKALAAMATLVPASSTAQAGWPPTVAAPAYARPLLLGFVARDSGAAAALERVQGRLLSGDAPAAQAQLDSLSAGACRATRERFACSAVRLAQVRVLEMEQRLPEALSALVSATDPLRDGRYPELLATAYLLRELIHEHLGSEFAAGLALAAADSVIRAEGLGALTSAYHVRAASFHRVMGRPDSARTHARRALAAAAVTGRGFDAADAHFLAAALAPPAEVATRAAHLERAGVLARSLGDLSGYAYNLAGRAALAAEAGDVALALARTDTALAFITDVAAAGFTDERYNAMLYRQRAGLFRALGRYDSAFASLERYADLETAIAYAANDEKVLEIERAFAAERNREALAAERAVLAVERSRAGALWVAALVLGALGIVLGVYVLRLRGARVRIREEVARQLTLRAEMQHRVKNNLQVLISLLEVQGEQTRDPEAAGAFAAMAQRVHGLATLHAHLDLHDGDAYVDARDYLDEVVGGYSAGLPEGEELAVDLEVAAAELPARMLMPVGIILNELLTNSLKHAGVPGRDLRVGVRLEHDGDRLTLRYRDNGPGLPPDAIARAGDDGAGLGLYLVRSMVRQLRGTAEVNADPDGVTIAIRVRGASPAHRSRLPRRGVWWVRGALRPHETALPRDAEAFAKTRTPS